MLIVYIIITALLSSVFTALLLLKLFFKPLEEQVLRMSAQLEEVEKRLYYFAEEFKKHIIDFHM